MMNKTLAFILLMVSVCANAATISVNGTDYDVVTTSGIYSDISSTLQTQIWWGDSGLAVDFAAALGTQLGAPNNDGGPSSYAPFFVFADLAGIFTAAAYNVTIGAVGSVTNSAAPSATWTYATATVSSVPLPAAAWMFGSALLGLGVVKRKKA